MNLCINHNGTEHWFSLPTDIEDIAEHFGVDLDETTDLEEELTFTDVETDLDIIRSTLLGMYLYDLNGLAECEDDYHDAAVAISEAYGLGSLDWTTCRNAYLAKVSSTEELGEYLVDNDYLGPIPGNLREYLDYEKIGKDWEWDGTWTSVGFLFNL